MSIIRKTKTVKLILQEFNENNEAVSVIKLIDKFKKNMNKTTVYRILDRLEDSGILHSFIDDDGYKRYAKGCQQNISSADLDMRYYPDLCNCSLSGLLWNSTHHISHTHIHIYSSYEVLMSII